MADGGAEYQVLVASAGSAWSPSRSVRLTVHPAFDLRFQWVGAPVSLSWRILTNLLPGTKTIHGVGAPLLVGEGLCAPAEATSPYVNCNWEIAGDDSVQGFETTYHVDYLRELGPWVASLAGSALVTSLDIEEESGVFAASALATSQRGTFTQQMGTSAVADLGAVASAQGAQGRILTAASFHGGQVTWVSYGWSEAPNARYEASVATSTIAGAPEAAAALAAQGYVITALGAGNLGRDGVVLVGTRAEGVNRAREVQAMQLLGQFVSPPGFAPVGYLFDEANIIWTMIFER